MESNKTVKLIRPIEIEGMDPVTEVTLKEPNSGNLRGLSLSKLFEMEVDTMLTLLPRISNLNDRHIANLSPMDYAPLFTETAGFFVSVDSLQE